VGDAVDRDAPAGGRLVDDLADAAVQLDLGGVALDDERPEFAGAQGTFAGVGPEVLAVSVAPLG
jgi:hypothetical protein